MDGARDEWDDDDADEVFYVEITGLLMINKASFSQWVNVNFKIDE
jgi:hypothetical protein